MSEPVRAVSAAIFHGRRFLLVRRGRAPGKGLYAFPGGRVEPGETLAEAVLREVAEETGARITGLRLLAELTIPAEDEPGRIAYVLSVHAAAFEAGPIVAGDDADLADWFTLDEMARLPLAGSVLEIARRIADGG